MYRLLEVGEYPKYGVDQFYNSQGIWITCHGDCDEALQDGDRPVRRKISEPVEGQKPSTNSAMVPCKKHFVASMCCFNKDMVCDFTPCLLSARHQ